MKPKNPIKTKNRKPITIDATSLKPEQPQPLGIMDLMPPELQEQIKAEVTREILAGLIRSISKQNIDEAIKAGMLQGIRTMQDIHNRTAPPPKAGE